MRMFVAAIAVAGLAQVAPRTVTFEAASLKPNASGGSGSYVGRRPGGRFAAENATLLELIQFAWQVPSFRVAGAPRWAASDRWNIAAKLETVPPPPKPGAVDDILAALQALLRDRFKLVIRRETREGPIYALVIDRSDGRLGPQMNRSAIDCAAAWSVLSAGGTPPAAARSCGIRGRIGSLQSVGGSLTDLAESLSERLQRQVVDRTGLNGGWDFTLTYSQDPSQISPGVLAPDTPPPPADPEKPSLFTALREQLGVKLDAARGPVEILVIERAERAVAN